MQDYYLTIKSSQNVEIPKIKGSRFIGFATPITSESEFEEQITAIRTAESNATHHCYAYKLGATGNNFRASDDGEPTGTAGLPILRQLDSFKVSNTLVCIVRYYGGTKLGKGGLIRAYGECARETLKECQLIQKVITIPYTVVFDYEDTSPVMRLLQVHNATILDTNYTDQTTIKFALRKSLATVFEAAFIEALSGRGSCKRIP